MDRSPFLSSVSPAPEARRLRGALEALAGALDGAKAVLILPEAAFSALVPGNVGVAPTRLYLFGGRVEVHLGGVPNVRIPTTLPEHYVDAPDGSRDVGDETTAFFAAAWFLRVPFARGGEGLEKVYAYADRRKAFEDAARHKAAVYLRRGEESTLYADYSAPRFNPSVDFDN